MLQITDLQQEQKIPPLLRLGFRPFFLFGALFSLLALLLWGLMLHNSVPLQPFAGAYWWHMHEMLFGFACAIIAGFLLTAVQNWTGARGISGKPLLLLVLLWLAGRIALLLPSWFGAIPATLIDLAFLPTVAYLLGKPIIIARQYRNLFFIPLLLLFTLANLQLHLAYYRPDWVTLATAGYGTVLLITVLMSVMAGRVTPMFTANGTGTSKVPSLKALEFACNGTVALAMLQLLLAPLLPVVPELMATTLLAAAVCHAIRWLRWRPWITLAVPLLWSLHIAMLFVWFGLLLLGLSYLMPEIPARHVLHLLTIGGMAGLILAMISRVSLGHTGRPLQVPKPMPLAFLLLFVTALVRAYGPWLMPANNALFIDISIAGWLCSFGLFVLSYAPMLSRPRADNRPG